MAFDVADRLRFLAIDDETREILRSLEPVVQKRLPASLEAFYVHVKKYPELARFFSGEQQMKSASGKQMQHWLKIVSGRFDSEYIKAVETIGQVHSRIGLEPHVYISSYTVLIDDMVEAIIDESLATSMLRRVGPQKISLTKRLSAFVRAALLDMELVLAVYFDAVNAKASVLEDARARSSADQAAITAALGSALSDLAQAISPAGSMSLSRPSTRTFAATSTAR